MRKVCMLHACYNQLHACYGQHACNTRVTGVLHACCTGVGNGSACTTHVVRVLSNMHVGSACNMHVVRVLE